MLPANESWIWACTQSLESAGTVALTCSESILRVADVDCSLQLKGGEGEVGPVQVGEKNHAPQPGNEVGVQLADDGVFVNLEQAGPRVQGAPSVLLENRPPIYLESGLRSCETSDDSRVTGAPPHWCKWWCP